MGGTRARVAVVRCADYDPERVGRAVAEAVELLGGMSRFVRPGERVLLKPNLLSAKAPERAITTHPEIVGAVAALVRAAGGVPSIGDSPGGAIRGVERVWRNTGMLELSERMGVPLVCFEASGSREVRGALRSYMIARPALEADAVLNIAKMKTHVLTMYTGCVKNMFGVIPGFLKSRLHSAAPRPVPFARHIVDVHCLVRPRLNVLDAVVAMEGDGPSGGRPRQVGAILAGEDAVAVDAVAAAMMGLGEGSVPTLRVAAERGLGAAALADIEVVGADPSSFDLSGFALPRTAFMNLIPDFVVRALEPWIWVCPEMSKAWGCRGEACRLCARSCPVGAIAMKDGAPVVSRKACVECLCCHEVCPEHAVRVRLSWLARRFA
ncbi:MAG: DUF362 domain-containing protein [Candidatus Eisenbacteria bacterium]|nr:DUF362 domain-containing protein [Candidatus Eisenbacteria bacterium]